MPAENTERIKILNSAPRGTLDENEACLSAVFYLPENKDIVIRKFETAGFCAMAAYLEGLTDSVRVTESIIHACILKDKPDKSIPKEERLNFLLNNVLFAPQASFADTFDEIARAMVSGICVLFAEGVSGALLLDVRRIPHRPVNRTSNESVVMGSQEGFVESLRTNISLIRKNLRSASLVTEIMEIGGEARMTAAILYLEGTVDEKVLSRAKERLKAIDRKGFLSSGQVQQLIEDSPMSLFPQMLETERPDRAAAGLMEGQFAIVMDNSPYALLAPVTLYHFLHASDDSFVRWQYGTFIRIVRMIGVLFSLLLPGMYIALTQYHSHLLPMNLLSSIAEARANVPFSILGEILFMEFSFNLINEAGTRIPSQIGSALGIVGALILGQAAVSASIASPILIIIVALTGLGNFVVPSYGLSLGMQIMRLFILLAGSLFGLYGIVLSAFMVLSHAAGLSSFGAPYLAPIAPRRRSNPDIIARLPIWLQKRKMFYAGKE